MTRRLPITICSKKFSFNVEIQFTFNKENILEAECWLYNIISLSLNYVICIEKMQEKIIVFYHFVFNDQHSIYVCFCCFSTDNKTY